MVFYGIAIFRIPFAKGLSVLENVTVITLSQAILRTFQKFSPENLWMTAQDKSQKCDFKIMLSY